jgi:hypothetical protein
MAASLDKEVMRMEGRDSVYVIPSKASRRGERSGQDLGSPASHWAVRHYARGGRLVARLLNDRYLRSSRIRPYHELAVSQEARRRGIPTPRVVAACLYPGRLFYRADLVTEFVIDSSDLVMALFSTHKKGAGGAGERLDALQASGELIRQMASGGLRHRDLHAGNLLLKWEGSAPRPHLLDLDRCEITKDGRAVPARPMQLRLERSLRKWESRTGIRISEKEWKTLARAAAS